MSREVLIVAILLGGVACSDVDGPSETPVGLELECGAPIENVDAVIGSGRLVMLGELHGTNQIPAFATELVCQAALQASSLEIHLGLELPDSEQARVDAFLEGDGDVAPLLSDFWDVVRDGRTSSAMLALLDRARVMRKARAGIEVFLFDGEVVDDDRDATMAQRVLDRRAAHPDALIVTLSGNVHSRTIVGISFAPDLVPMGFHIAQALDADGSDAVVALDAGYEAGTAWINRGDGAREQNVLGTSRSGDAGTVEMTPTDDGAHDGVFFVGPISAAFPAVDAQP